MSGPRAFLLFKRLMAFSTSSTVNGTSRICSSLSIETGISASILYFSSDRSGLSEATDWARFEKCFAHAFRRHGRSVIIVSSTLSVEQAFLLQPGSLKRRGCEEANILSLRDVCFQLGQHNILNSLLNLPFSS